MKIKIKQLIKRLPFFENFRYFYLARPKKTYSQCGEDIIIDYVFKDLGINKPTYLDVGTNHPLFLNNTYLFYKKGAQGVCVEPDSWLCKQIRQKRNRDVVLNMGVGENIGELDYYIMDVDTLNTFSKIDAEKYVCEGHIIKGVSKVKINSINRIIADNFLGHPNLLSIDIEGLDLLVLKSLDFLQYRPEIICAETLTYSRDGHEKKIQEIFDLLLEKGYFVYADTYINTIFVDKKSYADKNKKINI